MLDFYGAQNRAKKNIVELDCHTLYMYLHVYSQSATRGSTSAHRRVSASTRRTSVTASLTARSVTTSMTAVLQVRWGYYAVFSDFLLSLQEIAVTYLMSGKIFANVLTYVKICRSFQATKMCFLTTYVAERLLCGNVHV